jgi:hypothetical protein
MKRKRKTAAFKNNKIEDLTPAFKRWKSVSNLQGFIKINFIIVDVLKKTAIRALIGGKIPGKNKKNTRKVN